MNRQYWEKVKEGSKAEPSAPAVHYVEDDVPRSDVYNEEADEIVVGHRFSLFLSSLSSYVKGRAYHEVNTRVCNVGRKFRPHAENRRCPAKQPISICNTVF